MEGRLHGVPILVLFFMSGGVSLHITVVVQAFCCRRFCISEGVSLYRHQYGLFRWLWSIYIMLAWKASASGTFL
jgi:hypothetical protein